MAFSTSPASQKEIASQAGVSQSTVSLVLSGRGLIAEETRRRVLDTANRLRYRPNLLVHGMQTGKTRAIGVMAPPFDFYWSQVLYGIHDTLSDADHVPIMLWAAHDKPARFSRDRHIADELRQIHSLLDRRIDGVILWPPFATVYADHIHEFSSRDLPIVTIDHALAPEFRAAYVGSDEADAGKLVARHLYQLGHRSVGHLAGPAKETWSESRRRAFEEQFLALPGTTCMTIEAAEGPPSMSIAQARALVAEAPGLTAIYAATDSHAKLVYQAATERALLIPQDLSVVGFSDDNFASMMHPSLTTVRQPGYEIGAAAAEIVLQLAANGTSDVPIHKELPVLLCVRGSTTRPPASDRP